MTVKEWNKEIKRRRDDNAIEAFNGEDRELTKEERSCVWWRALKSMRDEGLSTDE
jgi:hypothetical protein